MDQIVLGETVTSARVENQPGSAGVVVSRLFQRELKSLRTFLNRFLPNVGFTVSGPFGIPTSRYHLAFAVRVSTARSSWFGD